MPVPEGERDSDSKSTDEGRGVGGGGGGGERWHTVRSSKYCAGARDTEQKEVRIKMIYSNLQVGIVMVGDFTGKTMKLKPSDG